jgi:hypothetical protein
MKRRGLNLKLLVLLALLLTLDAWPKPEAPASAN